MKVVIVLAAILGCVLADVAPEEVRQLHVINKNQIAIDFFLENLPYFARVQRIFRERERGYR